MSIPSRPGAIRVIVDNSTPSEKVQGEIDDLVRLLAYITLYPNRLPRPGFSAEQVQSRMVDNAHAKISEARSRLIRIGA
jgi:hypothetical protein